ncbi:hypothetical protein ML462_00140 [Gramella lutea]|uniref:Glucosamine inositolphosphorylceramide transferase 1 N-terminal domain-containing protein n=1 Tax=Christiangramia lutea TaxID=1607951 RepID=A0A9X1UZQ6_9FLAO|nr:hypothetical protein [Christiangramia lutea]MCH4821567.1 hypothetical protein [Christiangramia lutea]
MTIRKKYIVLFFLFILGVLLIFNYRYPFLVSKSKGWSIGFMKTDDPLKKLVPSRSNILKRDTLNSITIGNTRFIADPFLYFEENNFYIFFEHQEKKGPAKIGLFHSNDGYNYEFEGIVIEEPFHLSFPQVFEYRNKKYILPESASINNVVLYESVDFPEKWELRDTLISNISLKDPALLVSDNLNLIVGIDDNYKQRVFKSDSLFGDWEEDLSFNIQKGNEIRPAGNFFSVEGEWYLPFQNNTEGYGSGVSLYKLDFDKFEKLIENQLFRSDSIRWFDRGMHHLNVNSLNGGFYLVYDGDEGYDDEFDITIISSIKYNLSDLYNYLFR